MSQPTAETVKAAADGARWVKSYLAQRADIVPPRNLDVGLLSEIILDAGSTGRQVQNDDFKLGGSYPFLHCADCGGMDFCACDPVKALGFRNRKDAAVAEFYRDFHKLHLDAQCHSIARMIAAAQSSKFLHRATGDVFNHLIAHGGMQPFEMRQLWAQYQNVRPSERGRTTALKDQRKAIVLTLMTVLTGSKYRLPVSRNSDPSDKRNEKLNRLNACYIVSSICRMKYRDEWSFFDEGAIRKIWYERPTVETPDA